MENFPSNNINKNRMFGTLFWLLLPQTLNSQQMHISSRCSNKRQETWFSINGKKLVRAVSRKSKDQKLLPQDKFLWKVMQNFFWLSKIFCESTVSFFPAMIHILCKHKLFLTFLQRLAAIEHLPKA